MLNNEIALLIVGIAIILSTQSWYVRAIATSSEEFCFLITASGRVIDLSNAFCQSQQSELSSTKKDKAFVES